MAKVTYPLLSKRAGGKLGDIVFSSWRGIPYARSKGTYHDAKSRKQLPLRRRFKEAVYAWRALSERERDTYNKRASFLSLSGYNLFIQEYMQNAAEKSRG